MKKWSVISSVALVYFLIAGYYFYSHDPSFLYGEWSKTTSGTQKNIISKIMFSKDKSVKFMDQKGRILTKCTYSIQNNSEIDCLCKMNNKKGLVKLTLDGKDKIKNSFGDVYQKM